MKPERKHQNSVPSDQPPDRSADQPVEHQPVEHQPVEHQPENRQSAEPQPVERSGRPSLGEQADSQDNSPNDLQEEESTFNSSQVQAGADVQNLEVNSQLRGMQLSDEQPSDELFCSLEGYDAELEAYLDGQLNPAQQDAVSAQLEDRPTRQEQVALQARIDQALARLFPPTRLSEELLSAALDQLAGQRHAETEDPATATRPPDSSLSQTGQLSPGQLSPGQLSPGQLSPGQPEVLEPELAQLEIAQPELSPERSSQVSSAHQSNRPKWLVLAWSLAIAAVLLLSWGFLGGSLLGPTLRPEFEPTPVVELYRQAVAEGFKPYYYCQPGPRFQETFAHRQGQALRLRPLPEGTRMLGVSYPGGLTRETTGILCDVDNQPVMVFVDRASADSPQIQHNQMQSLRVFRDQHDGLVFYEVTPLDQPKILPHLVALDGPPRRD